MKLLFATNNSHKLHEIRKLMPSGVSILGLEEAGITEDIPETGLTLVDNALLKAEYAYKKVGMWCFADDTGLEVESLGGAPGVFSARYAGENKNADDNVHLLLSNLKGIENRRACFKTVIALIINDERHLFEGTVEGKIIETPVGLEGFGYDPVFIPEGYDITFAQMPLVLKNEISHRAIATKKMLDFLNQHISRL